MELGSITVALQYEKWSQVSRYKKSNLLVVWIGKRKGSKLSLVVLWKVGAAVHWASELARWRLGL